MPRVSLSLFLSAFVLVGLLDCGAFAQGIEPDCDFGLFATDGDTLQDYLVHVRGFTSYDPTISSALVPIYVVRELYAPPEESPTPADVDAAIEQAASMYAEYGLFLVKVGQEDLPAQAPGDLGGEFCRMPFELRDDAITVYLSFTGSLSSSRACGLGSRALFAEIDRDRVLVHELGHALGLMHTFQGSREMTYLDCVLPHPPEFPGTWPGVERWDMPLEDRFFVGDLVVDTPPDFGARGLTLPDCTLDMEIFDAIGLRACVGDSAFFAFPPEPLPLNNFMTYVAEDRMYCRTEFTDEQRRRVLLMIEASRDDPNAALYPLLRAPAEDILFPNGDTVYAGESVPIAWGTDFEYDLANPPNLLISSVSIEIVDPTTDAVIHAASELPHTGSYNGWTPSPLLAGKSAQVRLTFNTTIDHAPAVVTRTAVIENHPDAPQIESLTIAAAGSGSVIVSWDTDVPATGLVVATKDVDSTTVQETTVLGTSHEATLSLGVAATWQFVVSATAQGRVSMEARSWSTEFATSFTNVSDLTGLSVPLGSEPYSSAPLDFDRDGDEDLLISFENEFASLNSNSGVLGEAPQFDDLTLEDLHDGQVENTRGLAAADFNGDGYVDVFIADANSVTPANLLLAGTHSGVDSLLSTHLGAVETSRVRGASFGDFDGNGWLDLYVMSDADGTGDVLLQSTAAATSFVDVTAVAGLRTGVTHSTSAVWADLDLDGRADLVVGWGSPTGSSGEWSAYYLNQGPDSSGQVTFVDVAGVTSGPRVDAIGRVQSIAVADVSGDRKLDLLFATDDPAADTTLLAYINDGSGAFTLADSSLGLRTQLPLVDVAVTDLDGNAVLDIVAVPAIVGEVIVLSGHGDLQDRVFHDRSSLAGLGTELSRGLTLADFNGDTDADVFLLREELSAQPDAADKKFFWSNNLVDAGSQPASARAFSVGFSPWTAPGHHNTMGIGTQVSVAVTTPAGPILRTAQVIDGGSGRASQGSGRLIFGLAGASTAEITVRWPHGQTQVFDAYSSPGFPRVMLTDTSDPEIQSSTVTASYVPSSGYTTHTYTWKSTYPGGTPQVLITAGAKPADCLTPLGGVTQLLLDPSMGDVSTTSVPVNGEWVHTLTWIAYCTDSCTYTYYARNVVGGQVYSSTPKTLNVSVCADIAQ